MPNLVHMDDSGARMTYGDGAMREPTTGKGRFDLISPFALDRLAHWYEAGAKKYADRNWEKGMPFNRTLDSALRHLNRWMRGDRSEDHLAAAAWNVFAMLHFEETGQAEEWNNYPCYKRALLDKADKTDACDDEEPKTLPMLPHGVSPLMRIFAGKGGEPDVEWGDPAAIHSNQAAAKNQQAKALEAESTRNKMDRDYLIFAVDFDGCLCESAWPEIGQANIPLIAWLRDYRAHGHKLILWTCREGELLDDAVEWCYAFGLKFDAINANLPEMTAFYGNDSRKVGADYYIDDKAICSKAVDRLKFRQMIKEAGLDTYK